MLLRPNRVLQQYSPHPPGLVRARRDADASIRKYFLGLEYNNQQFYSMGIELLKLYQNIDSTDIAMGSQKLELGPYRIPHNNNGLMRINYFGGPGTFPTYSYETRYR
ncbi:MAG: hypothetical protein U5J63_17610 [Fodinibius sp.]|nr:hypothetical protein [Fodinibius sp.]